MIEGMNQTYRAPMRYLNGRAADMVFWDAVYWLLECHGRSDPAGGRRVEVDNRRLIDLTGLSKRQITTQRNVAAAEPPPYRLLAEDGSEPWSYVLVLPAYREALARHVIHKPVGLVEHGWWPHLYRLSRNSRLPLAVVNRLLWRPWGDQTMTVEELRQRCRRPDRKTPPDTAEVFAALELLQQQQVVERLDAERFGLRPAVFERPPAVAAAPAPPPAGLPPAVAALQREQPELAALLVQTAEMGRFALADHAEEMARDLPYVRSAAERALLLKKAQRERHAPPSPQRWRVFWRAFCRSRDRKQRSLSGPRLRIDLGVPATRPHGVPLPALTGCRVHWARLSVRLDDPDFGLRPDAPLALRLTAGATVLWERALTGEDAAVRTDLTVWAQQQPDALLQLSVALARPLPRATLEVQVEVACL